MKPTLLVLAAGIGSRYGGIKQIDPIGENGETIIDFSVFDAVKAGFGRVVFVIRREIETDFREIIGKKYEKKMSVDYVFQKQEDIPPGFRVPPNRTKPWGTGHAILSARSLIIEPFAVVNGDDFYGNSSFSLLAAFLKESTDEYAIVAYILNNTLSEHGSVSRGICFLKEENYLENIVEHTKIKRIDGKIYTKDNKDNDLELSGNEYVSMNMFGFNQGIFDHLEREFNNFLKTGINDPAAEFFIPTVVSNLIQHNLVKVKVLRSDSSWLGITYKEDKENVKKSIQKLIEQKKYPPKLW